MVRESGTNALDLDAPIPRGPGQISNPTGACLEPATVLPRFLDLPTILLDLLELLENPSLCSVNHIR